MLDKQAKGKSTPAMLQDVEKGAIRRFAEALGDTNPIYYDEQVAKAAGHRSLPAPPTFALSLALASDLKELLGVSPRQLLHSESAIEYFKSVCAGDKLLVTTKVADIAERVSPAGKIEVAIIEDEAKDTEGNMVFRVRRSYVVRSSKEAP